MALGRKPDAVIWPTGYFGAKQAIAEAVDRIAAEFGPVLDVRRVMTRPAGTSLPFNFSHPFGLLKDHSLFYPVGHDLEKEPRYDWYAATKDAQGQWSIGGEPVDPHGTPGVVLFGYVKPDPAGTQG
jgi:hypothetical protein